MKIFKNIEASGTDFTKKNNIAQVIVNKCLKALIVLSCIAIAGTLLAGVFFSPITVNICVDIGTKFLKQGKTSAAIKCFNVAQYISLHGINKIGRRCGEIEYVLAEIKRQAAPQETINLLTQAAEHGNAEASWKLANHYFKQANYFKGYYYLQMAADRGCFDAQFELAIYLNVCGQRNDKEYAWKLLKQLADVLNIENEKTIDAAYLLRRNKCYIGLNSKKITWDDLAIDPAHCYYLEETLSKSEKSIEYLYFGIYFIEDYIRLRYSPDTAQSKIDKIDKIVNTLPFSPTQHMKRNTSIYAGICSDLNVPGTGFKVKDFHIDTLLNRNMPLKEWGIYWLKLSSANGCNAADQILAILSEHKQ